METESNSALLYENNNTKKLIAFHVIFYHAESEGVDVIDVFEAILPRDETLDVDVELVPDAHDSFIILLIPGEQHKPSISLKVQYVTYLLYVNILSYLLQIF